MSRRRHNAFTTIELLVAISILVILAGMVFVGFKVVGTGGKTRSTRSTLESAKSLLTEVDVAKGMIYVKNLYVRPPNVSGGVQVYFFAFPPLPRTIPSYAPTGIPLAPTPIVAPADAAKNGNISEDAFSTAHTTRFQDPAIIRTQMVMARLMSVPANRTTIGQLPANDFLSWPQGTTPPPPTIGLTLQVQQLQAGPPVRYSISPPLLVDGWGNPILYVPPAGLRGVYFSDNPTVERVVTSVRIRRPYNAGSKNNPMADDYYNFDPGATGFWASAGPDGDFTKGDDNIYSFEGF